MKKKLDVGCLLPVLVIALLGGIATIYDRRPSVLVRRALGVEDVSELTDLRTKYVGGMDYTIYITAQAPEHLVEKIIAENAFLPSNSIRDRMVDKLNFEGAPQVPLDTVSAYRGQNKSTPMRGLAVSEDGGRFWYGEFDW